MYQEISPLNLTPLQEDLVVSRLVELGIFKIGTLTDMDGFFSSICGRLQRSFAIEGLFFQIQRFDKNLDEIDPSDTSFLFSESGDYALRADITCGHIAARDILESIEELNEALSEDLSEVLREEFNKERAELNEILNLFSNHGGPL